MPWWSWVALWLLVMGLAWAWLYSASKAVYSSMDDDTLRKTENHALGMVCKAVQSKERLHFIHRDGAHLLDEEMLKRMSDDLMRHNADIDHYSSVIEKCREELDRRKSTVKEVQPAS